MSDDNTPDAETSAQFADRLANRRRMAWVSLISMVVVVLLCGFIVDPTRLQILVPVLGWYFTICGGVIGAYMGCASFDHYKVGGDRDRNGG